MVDEYVASGGPEPRIGNALAAPMARAAPHVRP